MTIYFNINNSPQGTNVSYLTLTSRFEVLQISAFFLFSNIRKGRLLYIHPVGWSVGWSVDVTINFSIYRGKRALY